MNNWEHMKKHYYVFVLYDSITNSIFESQVLQPLIKRSKAYPKTKILLISFEKNQPSKKQLAAISLYKQIEIIILKRRPFLGMLSLKPATKTLHNIFKKLPAYVVCARGPHAGWISVQASKDIDCKQITIQARGLLAEEYAYVHHNKKSPFTWLHHMRKKQFQKLEQLTYGHHHQKISVLFQAVSPALKEYMIQNYSTNSDRITIARDDLPEPIPKAQLLAYYTATRTKLGIGPSTRVFCYNGSAKPWQCPEKIVQFFVEQQKKENKSFLLILSQDKKQFEKLLKKYRVDPSHFYVCTIPHHEIYHYLAACDRGLLFREKNIINWVSRPTKALEYKVAGLEIIHNNTVQWLQQQASNHS